MDLDTTTAQRSQPFGLRRVVDQVDGHGPGRHGRRIDRMLRLDSNHPHRCGVHHEVRSGKRLGDRRRPEYPAGRAGQRGGRLGTLRRAIDHGHVRGSGATQGMDHCACRSSRPDDHGPSAHRIEGRVVSQAVQKSGPVRVVPDQEVAIGHHAVDGIEGPGVAGQQVDGGGHRLLVGHGDREPPDAQRPHLLQRTGRPSLGDLHGNACPVQAGLGERRVHEGRRQRVADRITYDRCQPGVPTDRLPSIPGRLIHSRDPSACRPSGPPRIPRR